MNIHNTPKNRTRALIRELVDMTSKVLNEDRAEIIDEALILGCLSLLKSPQARHEYVILGMLDSIGYTAFNRKDGYIQQGESYIHEFENMRPDLVILPTGDLYLSRDFSEYKLVDSGVGLQIVG